MSVTLRLSCLAAALSWLPVAMAQLNPPLTGAGDAVAPPLAATPMRAVPPVPAASVPTPATAGAAARLIVRQVPAATAPASPGTPTPVAQAIPVPAPGATPAGAATRAAVSAPADTAAAGAPAGQNTAASSAAPAALPRLAGGGTTRGLLALQTSGRAAGPARPVLGPTAAAAWDRYVESFTHPVPEWFDRGVEETQ